LSGREDVSTGLTSSVVYEWLNQKREQGVEAGFKNGGPGDK
jgi:transposase